MNKPRKPGSQVAPGLKPLHTDRPTASKHSKVPIAQATEGKLYRVRDKDWVALWGENMSWADAVTLRDLVVGRKWSRTARVEDMALAPPAGVEVPPITALELGAPARAKHHPTRDTTVRPAATRTAPAPRDATVPGYRQIDQPRTIDRPAITPQRHNFSGVTPGGVVSGELNLDAKLDEPGHEEAADTGRLQMSTHAQLWMIGRPDRVVDDLPRFEVTTEKVVANEPSVVSKLPDGLLLYINNPRQPHITDHKRAPCLVWTGDEVWAGEDWLSRSHWTFSNLPALNLKAGDFRIGSPSIIQGIPAGHTMTIRRTDGSSPEIVTADRFVHGGEQCSWWVDAGTHVIVSPIQDVAGGDGVDVDLSDLGTVTEEDLENAEADDYDSPAP
jgi:hypothetical protein